MQESLIDISSKLQAIIDTAIDGIIVIDSHGIIEDINRAALTLFGYAKDEIVGSNVSILMPSPHQERHDEYIKEYQRSRIPRIIGIGREVEGRKKDGSMFPFRLAVSEVKLKSGTVFTGIVHDLTKVKAAEEARRKLTDELEQHVIDRTNQLEQVINRLLSTNHQLEKEVRDRIKAEEQLLEKEQLLKISLQKEKELNELKSRFMSMASHEFRTPLSTILSSVSLISRYQLTEQTDKRTKHVNRIKSSINNLTGILNDFLSLGKLEEGKVDLTLEQLDLNKLCEDIKDDLEGMLRPGQEIQIEVSGKVFQLYSDGRIIKNVFFNLLSNAIKYSLEGESVTCHFHYHSNEVKIEIIDRGIGIPESEQRHLFDRFFRASNVDAIQGTGLGLNIVQKYLELIQGSISFVSELNKGSTFTLIIPNYKSS